jgi:phenylalanyl-tRNA synthetase beta chain
VVRVRTARVNGLLGTALATDDVRRLLEPIGFACAAVDATDELDVHVPSYRPDTQTETDVVEEVARHHGYGNIPRTVPGSFRIGSLSARQTERRLLRQVLAGLGVDEAMPLPFLAPGDLEAVGIGSTAVTLTNPLVAEESVLRTSLRPGLLKAVAYNQAHRNERARLFEIGKVFLPSRPDEILPDEREALGAVLAGAEAVEAVELWRVIDEALALPGARMEQVVVDGLHPGRSAELVVGDAVVGVLGEVDPAVLERMGIAGRVAVLELDLDRLLAVPHGDRPYRPVSRFPSNDIDLAFEVDESVAAADVEDAVRVAAGELLADLRLFDVFRGPALPEGTRSLAFALRLQAPDRTLTDDEVGELRTRVIAAVEAALPARLRG